MVRHRRVQGWRKNKQERDFHKLRDHFVKKDMELIQQRGSRVFDTSHGIFGTSSLDELYELFKRVRLDKYEGFVDLGSGDGRIALLAALFTKSLGIEADASLHAMAEESQKALSFGECTFLNADYASCDLSEYDIAFAYMDHAWPEDLEKNLIETGCEVLSYQNIFSPKLLKKGRTLWVGQTPIVFYSATSS